MTGSRFPAPRSLVPANGWSRVHFDHWLRSRSASRLRPQPWGRRAEGARRAIPLPLRRPRLAQVLGVVGDGLVVVPLPAGTMRIDGARYRLGCRPPVAGTIRPSAARLDTRSELDRRPRSASSAPNTPTLEPPTRVSRTRITQPLRRGAQIGAAVAVAWRGHFRQPHLLGADLVHRQGAPPRSCGTAESNSPCTMPLPAPCRMLKTRRNDRPAATQQCRHAIHRGGIDTARSASSINDTTRCWCLPAEPRRGRSGGSVMRSAGCSCGSPRQCGPRFPAAGISPAPARITRSPSGTPECLQQFTRMRHQHRINAATAWIARASDASRGSPPPGRITSSAARPHSRVRRKITADRAAVAVR